MTGSRHALRLALSTREHGPRVQPGLRRLHARSELKTARGLVLKGNRQECCTTTFTKAPQENHFQWWYGVRCVVVFSHEGLSPPCSNALRQHQSPTSSTAITNATTNPQRQDPMGEVTALGFSATITSSTPFTSTAEASTSPPHPLHSGSASIYGPGKFDSIISVPAS